ncbi:Gfo/Idh/MocA family protein [Ferroacidibacillus organovorans]|uniref:Oxidoreductase n=1 Tax=Ferroacidibacillus organovorans TaxID=1765683 RepID=A0A853KCW1_9BACL|nr:Gfo/Idh/MocA family oxidoreductase [Ferroacidibacillus organovorans]KYP80254.1 hypothetical protein AYJ22_11915 [Ferroacidibacillus organovorans]OAG93240.1 hypothetical protein AYW79_11700 [Ferroacidibacillus organovorans]
MGIRVGIIGTGYGAKVHAPVLLKHPDYELVALSGVRPGRARAEAERLSIPHAFDDWKEMIEASALEMVVIASEPMVHANMTIAALEAGVHVLCEKPPALNLDEVKAMKRVADVQDRHLFINFEWRYLPERQMIKRILDEGSLGDVIHVHWRDARGMLDRIREAENTWLWKAERGGGMLGAVGSHMIDALHHWFGEMETVHGQLVRQIKTRRGVQGLEESTADDSFMILGMFQKGGTCSVQFISSAIGVEPQLEIFGTKGTLVLEGDSLRVATTPSAEFKDVGLSERMDESGFPAAIQAYIHPQWTLYTEIARALAGEKPDSLPDFDDAIRVQSVLDQLRYFNNT